LLQRLSERQTRRLAFLALKVLYVEPNTFGNQAGTFFALAR
jgi:hypothetical protein